MARAVRPAGYARRSRTLAAYSVLAVTLAAVGATGELAGLAGGSQLPALTYASWRETKVASPFNVRAATADDAGLYVVGNVHGLWPATTGVDVYVRRFDLQGNEVWVRQFGTA